MIQKKGDNLKTEVKNVLGGNETVYFEHLLQHDKGEMYGKGRLYSVVTLPPGASVGYHVHNGEMECYYIIKGSGKYNDNNETEVIVTEGDTTVTPGGCGHSLANESNDDLIFIALILFTE